MLKQLTRRGGDQWDDAKWEWVWNQNGICCYRVVIKYIYSIITESKNYLFYSLVESSQIEPVFPSSTKYTQGGGLPSTERHFCGNMILVFNWAIAVCVLVLVDNSCTRDWGACRADGGQSIVLTFDLAVSSCVFTSVWALQLVLSSLWFF